VHLNKKGYVFLTDFRLGGHFVVFSYFFVDKFIRFNFLQNQMSIRCVFQLLIWINITPSDFIQKMPKVIG
jgi:hypothetical protein